MSAHDDIMAEIARLKQQERAYYLRMDKALQERVGTGNRHKMGPRQLSPGLKEYYANNAANGDPTLPYGFTPQPADVRRFIEGMGGNPYTKKIAELHRGLGKIKNPSKRSKQAMLAEQQASKAIGDAEKKALDEQRRIQKLQDDLRKKQDEANQANLDRYNEGLARLEARYDRAMGGIDDYGKSREDLIDERFDEYQGNIFARRARRGFNVDVDSPEPDTVSHAFALRADRDREFAKNDLADRLADRRTNIDARLSKDIVDFMERRTDEGPNQAEFLALAEKYGLGNAGQGFDSIREAANRDRQQLAQSGTQAQKRQQMQQLLQYARSPEMTYGGGGAFRPAQVAAMQAGITGMLGNVVDPVRLVQYQQNLVNAATPNYTSWHHTSNRTRTAPSQKSQQGPTPAPATAPDAYAEFRRRKNSTFIPPNASQLPDEDPATIAAMNRYPNPPAQQTPSVPGYRSVAPDSMGPIQTGDQGLPILPGPGSSPYAEPPGGWLDVPQLPAPSSSSGIQGSIDNEYYRYMAGIENTGMYRSIFDPERAVYRVTEPVPFSQR